jgi:VIT1/CCC1 family predicted Fe2+/Mn2+ transporter
MQKISRESTRASYLRNFVFGVEDSLVSTVGLVSGIAIVETPVRTIILTGTVLIFVEAFSMATGSVLSEQSAEEYVTHARASYRRPIVDGIIMFFSYFVTGFIPLLPHIFFSAQYAFWASIIISLIVLAAGGALSATVSKTNIIRNSLRMLIIGSIAIVMGVVVGALVNRIE